MNIEDVAAKAEVSKTTVSRVINANPTVTAEVARRVKSAMAELGYVPPARRRGPKPKVHSVTQTRTGTLGFLLFGRGRELLEFPYNARILSGFMDEAAGNGLQTVVIDMPDTSTTPQVIMDRALDGVVIIGSGVPPVASVVDAFHPLPCIWIGGTASDAPIADQVVPHNRAAGRMAADYLIGCGCRHTAFLNHDPQHDSFVIRETAFVQHMAAAGIPVASPMMQTNGTEEAALWDTPRVRKGCQALIEQAFSGSVQPDGIFTPTDQQAAMVHQLLRERGLTPGKDVITISCNNDRQWLATLYPQPATIDLRAGTLGQEAAQRLAWRMDHPQSDPTVIMVAPRLVDGD